MKSEESTSDVSPERLAEMSARVNAAFRYAAIRKYGRETRDPGRIDPLLDKLGSIWKREPDTRLGQLLMNIIGSANQEHYALGTKIRMIEDDELDKILDSYAPVVKQADAPDSKPGPGETG